MEHREKEYVVGREGALLGRVGASRPSGWPFPLGKSAGVAMMKMGLEGIHSVLRLQGQESENKTLAG